MGDFPDIPAGKGIPLIDLDDGSIPAAEDWLSATFVTTAKGLLPLVSAEKTAAQNSTAIQAAITAAATSGAEVFIPGGTFDHQGFTIPAAGNITVRGNGRGKTILRNTHATNPSVRIAGTPSTGPYAPSWELSGLTLTTDMPDAPGQTGGGRSGQVGLDVLLASRFSVSNLEIRAHGIGVRHEASWDCDYDTINVGRCDIGWQFPATSYTVSAPFRVNSGSAWRCGTAVQMQAVESLVWDGGDFAYSTNGIVIVGDTTRVITFKGVNFEGITGDDISFGDGTTGPSNVSFDACRFSGGSGTKARGVWQRRGQGLSFRGCHFSLYTLAVRQESPAGTIEFLMCNTASVTSFLDSNGAAVGNSTHLLAIPNTPVSLNPSGQSSVTRSFAAFDGLVTKGIAGAGKTAAADGDFTITPSNNQLAVVRNTTTGDAWLAVRVNGTWMKVALTT